MDVSFSWSDRDVAFEDCYPTLSVNATRNKKYRVYRIWSSPILGTGEAAPFNGPYQCWYDSEAAWRAIINVFPRSLSTNFVLRQGYKGEVNFCVLTKKQPSIEPTVHFTTCKHKWNSFFLPLSSSWLRRLPLAYQYQILSSFQVCTVKLCAAWW